MVWGSGGVAGRAGAGVGGAAGAPSHEGAPGCGWDQAGLLHLSTFQTRRLKSSADMGRTLVSNGLPAGLEASGADTPLPTFLRNPFPPIPILLPLETFQATRVRGIGTEGDASYRVH